MKNHSETSTSRHQAPEKLQISNTRHRPRRRVEAWRLFWCLAFGIWCFRADAGNLLVDVHSFTSANIVNRRITLTLLDPGPITAGPWLIAGDSVAQFTDTNGITIFTNVLAGGYRLDIAGTPSRSFPFGMPDTNSIPSGFTTNVVGLIGATNTLPWFYTAAQLDALLASENGTRAGTNVTVQTNGTTFTVNVPTDGNSITNGPNGLTLAGSATNLFALTNDSRFLSFTNASNVISGIASNMTVVKGQLWQNGTIVNAAGSNILDPNVLYLGRGGGRFPDVTFGQDLLIDTFSFTGGGVQSIDWSKRLAYGLSASAGVPAVFGWTNGFVLFDTPWLGELASTNRASLTGWVLDTNQVWNFLTNGLTLLQLAPTNGLLNLIGSNGLPVVSFNASSSNASALTVNGTAIVTNGLAVGTNTLNGTNVFAVSTPWQQDALTVTTNGDVRVQKGMFNILYQMTNAPLTITSTTTNSIWGAGQGSIVLPPNVLQLGSLIRVHFVGAMSNTTTLTFTNQFLLNGAAFLVQQTSYNSSIKWPCRSHGDGWYAKVTKTGTAGTIAAVMATEIPNGTLLWQQTNSYPINTTVANTFDATMAWSGAGNTVYVYDSTLELLSPP